MSLTVDLIVFWFHISILLITLEYSWEYEAPVKPGITKHQWQKGSDEQLSALFLQADVSFQFNPDLHEVL